MKNLALTPDEKVFNLTGYLLLTALTVVCVLPFLLVVTGSLTPEDDIYQYGYRLIPQHVSTKAYEVLFQFPKRILNAYGVSILVTVIGTISSLFFTSMAAFVLSRPDFKYRNAFSFFFYFTMLFSGGLVPLYIWIVRYLHLKNTLLALILPMFITAWHLFLLRNFLMTVPNEIIESAKIDGAHDFTIFHRICLPLAVPGLVTIGLFKALYYWNDWFQARLYITDQNLIPLQYFLYNTLNMVRFIGNLAGEVGIAMPDLPSESLKLAMAVVATGPILFLYPFAQRYFIKGLMIGGVKG